MGKFFVPAKWDKVGDAIKFKSGGGNNTNKTTENEEKKAAKKLKKKMKLAAKKNFPLPNQGKGPLAPKSSGPGTEATISEQKINKTKTGRIEKKKLTKKQNDKNQINMKKIKAAVAAFEGMDETATTTTTSGPSSLEARFKEQLMGGRFRYLNEQLYTMDSKKAMSLFREDPQAFDAYHAGYRHQVEKWPINPLNRIIKSIRRLPKSLEIGDFGCGEGKLAKSVPNKVFSMDLVNCRDDIIACDMASTPLQNQSLDVAVYCLSLMGTNLKDYLLEANRVLKMGGLMLIAEIQTRFDNLHSFIKCLEACGFELIKKDINTKVFYFFEFKKVRNVGKVALIPDCPLKPCLYRKR